MTRSKLLASLTGIGILFGLVIAGTPRTLQSYFSSVVRAQVGSVIVADFQAPQVELTLQEGPLLFYGPTELSEPADPVLLTGSATHTISLTGQQSMSQVVQLSMQFSGEVGVYQSQPCLTFLLENQPVYSVLCQSVTDTDSHTLFIPVAQLRNGMAEVLHVQSQLPNNQTVTLSAVHQSTWFLTAQTQVAIRAVDTTSIQIASSIGSFHQEGGVFILQPESVPENQTVLLVVEVTDYYGNTTQVEQLVHRVSLPIHSNENTVAYFPENDGSYHAVVQLSNPVVWYQPMYLKNTDLAPISSRLVQDMVWYPIMRHQEPESLRTPSKQLYLYDSFLQQYPLIETE